MSAVGIVGGSFDPVHHGHLITAQDVALKRNLEKVFFIPCYISPHKVNVEYSSPEHRVNMLKLAIEDHPLFEFSDFEINRKEISYTVNTLMEFSKKYDEIELIIGFDNLLKFDSWKEPDTILKLAKLIVMKRHIDTDTKIYHKYFGEAVYVDTPTIEISGTEIRERIRKNLPIDYLVPPSVKNYIFENNLYRY